MAAIRSITLACATLLAAAASAQPLTPPKFNMTKCPSFHELRAPHITESLSKKDIPGFYYELALHDLTQYPLCPQQPKCITANKTLEVHPDGVEYVKDVWNLNCFGHFYPQVLLFNITADPGYLEGYVPVTKIPFLPKKIVASTVFPDTIIDFKAGPDGWLLEFQCIEFMNRVIFTGINFYSKQQTEQAYNEMRDAGTAQGIDFFWNQGLGLRRVNFDDCPPPPPVPN